MRNTKKERSRLAAKKKTNRPPWIEMERELKLNEGACPLNRDDCPNSPHWCGEDCLTIKKYQKLYYEKLFGYHNGQVADWVDFFLDGVIEIVNEAIDIVEKITELREKDIQKIQKLGTRASESATMILPKLYGQPIVNVPIIREWTGFTRAGAQHVINRFVDMEILIPKDQDKKYGQSYVYKKYLDLFYKNN